MISNRWPHVVPPILIQSTWLLTESGSVTLWLIALCGCVVLQRDMGEWHSEESDSVSQTQWLQINNSSRVFFFFWHIMNFNNLYDFWKRQLGLFLVEQGIFCKQAGMNVRVGHMQHRCACISSEQRGWVTDICRTQPNTSTICLPLVSALSHIMCQGSVWTAVISGSKQNILLLSLMTSHGEVTGRCQCFVIGHKWTHELSLDFHRAVITCATLELEPLSYLTFSSSYEWNDHIKDHL